jgi:hypothetical protein
VDGFNQHKTGKMVSFCTMLLACVARLTADGLLIKLNCSDKATLEHPHQSPGQVRHGRAEQNTEFFQLNQGVLHHQGRDMD